jgi:predicted GH43/DUF377 family glycosyl hydrolase
VRDLGLAVRSNYKQRADSSRVIARLFVPGQELIGGGEARTEKTVQRVLQLSDESVETELDELFKRFSNRHANLADVFERHAAFVVDRAPDPSSLSVNRRQLLGAAFTHEYSVEGAAVCNPSLVPHFDQSDVPPDCLRVVLSFRSIGEGHHSSIAFRTGMVRADGELVIDEPQLFPVVAEVRPTTIERAVFAAKMRDAYTAEHPAHAVIASLGGTFDRGALEGALAEYLDPLGATASVETGAIVRSLAARFYEASFDRSVELSRRVLWPHAPAEMRGMEDSRFVRFSDTDGDDPYPSYLATYTAFNGNDISQQLLTTRDFASFEVTPIAGPGAQNKGLAIFPRRISGRFAALSRCDRESNAITYSDDLRYWDDVTVAQIPNEPWEIIQLGNCGSPIELPEGWLVITHGVGPMRTYGISAVLLDLADPTKVIATLPRPLLLPSTEEQDGYVPNVVYSCGSLVFRGVLYIPYGIADGALSSVSVQLTELLDAFVPTC